MKLEVYNKKVRELNQKVRKYRKSINVLENFECRNETEGLIFDGHQLIKENFREFCKICGINKDEIV